MSRDAPHRPAPPEDPGRAAGPRAPDAPLRIDRPSGRRAPVVVASPHSGRAYPPAFVARARIPLRRLRSSEDCFVEEIFAGAPTLGAAMLRAQFPRVFVDVNREPWELDPAMFADALPGYAVTRNARIAAGLGTIARVVADSEEIYAGKLRFAEAERRVREYYRPYHAALRGLVDETRALFGHCVLLDCHSMPSATARPRPDRGGRAVDFVLGDCHGTSCDPAVTAEAERALAAMGYAVRRNAPYAGGFVTRHYGRPGEGVHALQVEINRAIYMDEERLARRPGIFRLARDMRALVAALGALPAPSPAASLAAE